MNSIKTTIKAPNLGVLRSTADAVEPTVKLWMRLEIAELNYETNGASNLK